MQYGFYFDQNRCTGCFVCVVACKDWHDVPAGPASWRRVKTVEKGKYPDLFVAFLATTCYHCLQPACIPICPVGAITKREEDGIVTVDREICLGKDGCQQCLEACTYDAPQFGDEEDATMQKCDMCIDRWAEGKKPVCVDSCPTRALDAGPIEVLRRKYGDARQTEGFAYSNDLIPSVIFKPKNGGEGLALQQTNIVPEQ
jgi:anaerobic dimethyl sulfoxide reductase subunit B